MTDPTFDKLWENSSATEKDEPGGAGNANRALTIHQSRINRERTAPHMVEPAQTPAIHPTEDRWAHEHIARSQTCPVCFGSVAKHATRENRGIVLATYVCERQHCWDVRWGLAQVAA